MRIFNSEYFSEFEASAHAGNEAHTALLLDSSLASDHIEDISYAHAGEWVVDEISRVNLSDPDAVRRRIGASLMRLEDVKALALWPIAAYAHMQLVYQLKHVLDNDAYDPDADDMQFTAAAKWADDQVIAVDLRDPFAIADRIALSAEKLASAEKCRQWPGSAYAHRKVVSDLTVFLNRTRGTVH